jgi:hypothetical protein
MSFPGPNGVAEYPKIKHVISEMKKTAIKKHRNLPRKLKGHFA